jgi:4-hydroxyphenylpyruvate dioxygenase
MTTDPFPVKGIDHVTFVVGNAKQAAHFYSTAFGMTCVAYRGPEQAASEVYGVASEFRRDYSEYVLVSGGARFVLRGAVRPDAEEIARLAKHGDGVSDIALEVPDVDEAYRYAVAHGATGTMEPHDLKDGFGTVRMAAIATYGDTVHTLIDRSSYAGPFLPGFVDREPIVPPAPKQDGRVGRVLQERDGLHQYGGVHR